MFRLLKFQPRPHRLAQRHGDVTEQALQTELSLILDAGIVKGLLAPGFRSGHKRSVTEVVGSTSMTYSAPVHVSGLGISNLPTEHDEA